MIYKSPARPEIQVKLIMKTILFVTNNFYKFQIAKKTLRDGNLKIVQKKLEVPEIQDELVENIASFSARWASSTLRKPVIVSDGGCYIETLGGFPGPFVKYINQWLKAKDLLCIMQNKKNRRVVWKDCLAYCEPNKKPVIFTSYFKGKLAQRAGKNTYRKKYGWIDTLFIPDGFTKPLSEFSTKEYLEYWSSSKNYKSWQKLIKFLKINKRYGNNP